MNMIIKNALKNLIRNKGRTTLVSIIVGMIMIASSCALVIHSSAKQLVKQQMEAIGAQVIIVRNDDKLTTDLAQYKEISAVQMKSFAQSSLIHSSRLYGSAVGKADLETIPGSNIGSGVEGDGSTPTDEQGAFTWNEQESANVMLIGSTDQKINDDFRNGIRKIIKGSMYSQKYEIVIGEALAKKNNLKVKDVIRVALVDYANSKGVPTLELTITGIFEDYKKAGIHDVGSLNRHNEIFMNYDTLLSLSVANATQGGLVVEGSFQLKEPEAVKKLQEEFYQKGMPEYYELSINQHAYDVSVAPLEQIISLTEMMTIILLGIGALLMITLSLLSIRERTYEIGVLRAMGMKKRQIIVMLCVEVCTICVLCAMVALVITQLFAQPIANFMLANVDVAETIQFGAFFIGSGDVEAVSNIPAFLSMDVMMIIMLVAIGLGLLGSIGGVWYITKQEPMRILAERK